MLSQPRQVEEGIGTTLTPLLPFAGIGDQQGGTGGVIAGWSRRVERRGFASDGQVQVDAIQQRAGELVAIALNLFRRAATTSAGLAEITARAGIHGCHQLEACRETYPVSGSGNDDFTGL